MAHYSSDLAKGILVIGTNTILHLHVRCVVIFFSIPPLAVSSNSVPLSKLRDNCQFLEVQSQTQPFQIVCTKLFAIITLSGLGYPITRSIQPRKGAFILMGWQKDCCDWYKRDNAMIHEKHKPSFA